jgi:PAS domain S-box-containing protein
MPELSSIDVLARVASALADADPARGLGAALLILAELGIVPHAAGRSELWLSVTHADRQLALGATREAPSAELRSVLDGLLRVALARCDQDVTLQRERERMQLLSAASFEGLLFHVDGVVFDANHRLAEMLGYEPNELLGEQTLRRVVAPEDLPKLLARMAEGQEGEYVITGIRKDGSRFRAELQAKQGTLGERPVRVVAVRDVTARDRTQTLLRESETRLRNLAAATFDLTLFIRDGVIVDVAGSVEKVLGYTREEFVGRNAVEFVDPRYARAAVEALAKDRVGVFETVGIAKTGEAIPFEVIAVHSTLQGEPVRMSAIRDLRPARRLEDERRKLQVDLERSQRLDSLGLLAGGIAHDFNNLLTGVLGYAELLQLDARDPLERERIRGIIDAAQRAASLTAQLLAYAGRKELGPRVPVDLSELLRELRVLFDVTLSKKARVSLSVEAHHVVLGNRATLTQVVMNLLTNASDALGADSGAIGVKLSRVTRPDARFARALGAKIEPGEWVLLEVTDSGCGMDEATQARIFEPFFSTKEQGHGLGLAASVGIVTSHGGAILVESAPGRGSKFSVLLPAHAGRPRAEPIDGRRAPLTLLRVLIVDDEPIIRSQLSDALRARGYEVTEASNGHGALAALDQDAAHAPSLILLDMTMPDLSGIEVLRRIRESGSNVPVVLSSGYHDAALKLDASSFQGFLVKPYTLSQLFDALERAIERTS